MTTTIEKLKKIDKTIKTMEFDTQKQLNKSVSKKWFNIFSLTFHKKALYFIPNNIALFVASFIYTATALIFLKENSWYSFEFNLKLSALISFGLVAFANIAIYLNKKRLQKVVDKETVFFNKKKEELNRMITEYKAELFKLDVSKYKDMNALEFQGLDETEIHYLSEYKKHFIDNENIELLNTFSTIKNVKTLNTI